MAITELSQDETDDLRRRLGDAIVKDFMKAFSEEEGNLAKGDRWSLDPAKRIYYLVSTDDSPYLLAGVNPNPTSATVNLSSFARVAQKGKRGSGEGCVRELVEVKLVPMCRQQSKVAIVALALTDGGRMVLECLERKRPKGISRVDRVNAQLVWKFYVR